MKKYTIKSVFLLLYKVLQYGKLTIANKNQMKLYGLANNFFTESLASF